MRKHFMLDIETMGVADYSIIIAIGISYFNPNDQGKILERFYVTIDPQEAEKIGLRFNASTVMFWMHPKQRTAWDQWMTIAHVDAQIACMGMTEWFTAIDKTYDTPEEQEAYEAMPADEALKLTLKNRLVWGNGPDFDNRLMRQMFERLSYPLPWSYMGDRCFRTMKSLPKANECRPADQGTVHNAIDDADYQALWLQNILKVYDITL